MGKGDKKSRRGKIIIGSYGVRRPKSSKNKGFVKTEAASVEAVETVKKVTDKPKASPKPKEKVTESTATAEVELTVAPKKVTKKAVKKAVQTEDPEKV